MYFSFPTCFWQASKPLDSVKLAILANCLSDYDKGPIKPMMEDLLADQFLLEGCVVKITDELDHHFLQLKASGLTLFC